MTTRPVLILHRAHNASRSITTAQKRCFRGASRLRAAAASPVRQGPRTAGLLLSLTAGGVILYGIGYPARLHAEVIPAPAEVKFEQSRKAGTSREENRDLISSQHLQVKRSWENPGVYACKQPYRSCTFRIPY